MSDDRTFERIARAWLELGPAEAPDPVVEAALLSIESTPQERDLRIPRRIAQMNRTVRLLGAAAALVVVVAGSAWYLAGSQPAGVGGNVPTASPSIQPSESPSGSVTNITSTATYVPWQSPAADLVAFTSPTYGYSIRYPSNWKVRAATAQLRLNDFPYEFHAGVDNFGALVAVHLSNPQLVVGAATLVGPLPLSDWEATVRGWAATTCSAPALEDATIGGEPARVIIWTDCPLYLVWGVVVHGDRAFHVIVADALAKDDPSLRPADRALFDAIIPTFAFGP